jgi:hypothetical protein
MKHLHTFNSFLNEGKELSFTIDYNTDEDDIAYVQNVLSKAGVNATAVAGFDSEEVEITAKNAMELRKAQKAIAADGFQINESMYGKPTKDSSIMEHYGKTVKQVLEDEDGLNSYLTIQFEDNTQMIITAYPTGSGGVDLMVESLNEKFIYPEGVKTTGDKILDKTAKLLHAPAGTITIGTGSVRGQNIPFFNGPETFLASVAGEKYTILCGKGEFEIDRKDIKNAEELYDQIEKAIQLGEVTLGTKKK